MLKSLEEAKKAEETDANQAETKEKAKPKTPPRRRSASKKATPAKSDTDKQ